MQVCGRGWGKKGKLKTWQPRSGTQPIGHTQKNQQAPSIHRPSMGELGTHLCHIAHGAAFSDSPLNSCSAGASTTRSQAASMACGTPVVTMAAGGGGARWQDARVGKPAVQRKKLKASSLGPGRVCALQGRPLCMLTPEVRGAQRAAHAQRVAPGAPTLVVCVWRGAQQVLAGVHGKHRILHIEGGRGHVQCCQVLPRRCLCCFQ